jgi:hypothetical protein
MVSSHTAECLGLGHAGLKEMSARNLEVGEQERGARELMGFQVTGCCQNRTAGCHARARRHKRLIWAK